jgi:four helix bundle protein
MKTHKDLDVWKNSINFVTTIYETTKSFPNSEMFGLVNQIRRAAVSVPSNISEGASRNSNKEFIRFLYISLGSISEIETQLIISQNLNYISERIYNELTEKLNLIKVEMLGLIKFLKNKESGNRI